MAAALTGLTSMAARRIMDDVSVLHESRTGRRISFVAMGGVDAAQRIRDGATVDIVALAFDAITALANEGHILPDQCIVYARSGIAVAVPENRIPPAMRTEAEVLAAMLAARLIAYSTGPSGNHLKMLWARWGLAEEMQSRAMKAPPGVPVATFLANGEADIGFQQFSELVGQPGIAIAGQLPAEIQSVTEFAAGIAATARESEAANDFLDTLRTPEAAAIIKKHGMDPV